MSKIEEIIKEKCPHGVEYKTIKEITNVLRGKRLTTKELNENEKFPVYHGGLEPLGYYHEFNRIGDTVMIINVGASAGTVGYCKDNFWSSDGCYCIEHRNVLLNRYLYHYLKNNEQYFMGRVRKAGIPTLDGGVIEKFKIAVPPIEVQEEIVKILDKFCELETELEAELKAELEMRKSEYEFWRRKLLTTKSKKYKLEEIANFAYGFTGKALDEGNARYIRITDISEDGYLLNDNAKYLNITNDNKKYILKQGDLVVARTGASYGKTLCFDDDFPGIYASFLIKIELNNDIVLNKYYWHFSKSALYWNQANNLVSKAGQPQFNSNAIKKIEIGIPTIEEQEKIINILDKFDKLVNELSEVIPVEIETRRKQCAYYRNKLLSFEEVSCE